LTDIDFSIVSDPAFFAATAISDTSILLGFTKNANNDNILIAWNLTGIFTAPSGAPPHQVSHLQAVRYYLMELYHR